MTERPIPGKRPTTRHAIAAGALCLLAACAGTPVPDWQANAHGALAGYRDAYLDGNARAADAEFARARSELARTGRPDLVARAELTRCALQVASVQFDDCPGFEALAGDAGAEAAAYAAFLAGRPTNGEQLPAHYRRIATGDASALADIDSPLPKLIAAGVLLRNGGLPPDGVGVAVDTASAQGWRRPLLAWLGVQAQLAEARGDVAGAASVRRRITLIVSDDRRHGDRITPPADNRQAAAGDRRQSDGGPPR